MITTTYSAGWKHWRHPRPSTGLIPCWRANSPPGKAVFIGLISAAALYLIFFLGKEISTLIFPFAAHQIGSVYGKGQGTSMGIIFFLLFFITGPAEEIYWRGYVQNSLMHSLGDTKGWLVTTAIYAGVHLWSFNFMLIAAAGAWPVPSGGLCSCVGEASPR